MCESHAHSKAPRAIVGDLNGEVDDFTALSTLLQQGWVDVGSRAEIWNGPSSEPTCLAPGAKKATRPKEKKEKT